MTGNNKLKTKNNDSGRRPTDTLYRWSVRGARGITTGAFPVFKGVLNPFKNKRETPSVPHYPMRKSWGEIQKRNKEITVGKTE